MVTVESAPATRPWRRPVLVLDFGSQVTQLIARRVRELSVYCEIHPYSLPIEQIRELEPPAIILSGGPASVLEEGAPHVDPALFELGVPVLGICYGMQLINVLEGGSLVQHLRRRRKGPVVEHPGLKTPRHQVAITPGTRLAEILGVKTASVVTGHHQAVRDIAPGFIVAAVAPDGVIEAIEHPAMPNVIAVQWHPEHTPRSRITRRLFKAFVADCERYRAKMRR